MGDTVNLIIDDVEVTATAGETILEAADKAGIYIPRLCAKEGLSPFGACRVCTVLVNGRPQAACIQPVAEGIVVENNTERVNKIRRDIIEMLFVEGNHFCMFCERSGDCELQALAYRFGIMAPKYPYMFPKREVEASHPDILLDQNRCVLCARCVRASKEIDGKNVFGFVGRGAHKKVSVNAEAGLGQTDAEVTDRAADVCPVGAIIKKRTAYQVPIGRRTYDTHPIGSDIEAKNQSRDS
jgi:[NiFe] hydrogenase diaphorase moiety small subunit